MSGDFVFELSGRGWGEDAAIERAGLERPEILRDVAHGFMDAGARILITPTDRANLFWHSQGGGEEKTVREMNRACAAALREVADSHPSQKVAVIGAIGPPAGLMSLQEVGPAEIESGYRTQVEGLIEGGADAFLLRGFTEIQSLVAAVELVRKAGDSPIIGSLIFDAGINYTETAMGVSAAEACRQLVEAGVVVVGCDHGEFPDATAGIVGVMRQACELPIWAEVNAGQPELRDGHAVYVETPKDFAARLERIAKAGASIIGGGYGVSIEHTVAAAQVLTRFLKSRPLGKKG